MRVRVYLCVCACVLCVNVCVCACDGLGILPMPCLSVDDGSTSCSGNPVDAKNIKIHVPIYV